MVKQSGETKRPQGQQQGGKRGKVTQQQQSRSPDEDEFPSNQTESTEQEYLDDISQTHQQQRKERE